MPLSSTAVPLQREDPDHPVSDRLAYIGEEQRHMLQLFIKMKKY